MYKTYKSFETWFHSVVPWRIRFLLKWRESLDDCDVKDRDQTDDVSLKLILFINFGFYVDVCHKHLGRIRRSCEWSRYSYFYILIYLTKIRGFIILLIVFLLVLLLSQFIEAKRFGNKWFHCFLRRTKKSRNFSMWLFHELPKGWRRRRIWKASVLNLAVKIWRLVSKSYQSNIFWNI